MFSIPSESNVDIKCLFMFSSLRANQCKLYAKFMRLSLTSASGMQSLHPRWNISCNCGSNALFGVSFGFYSTFCFLFVRLMTAIVFSPIVVRLFSACAEENFMCRRLI